MLCHVLSRKVTIYLFFSVDKINNTRHVVFIVWYAEMKLGPFPQLAETWDNKVEPKF